MGTLTCAKCGVTWFTEMGHVCTTEESGISPDDAERWTHSERNNYYCVHCGAFFPKQPRCPRCGEPKDDAALLAPTEYRCSCGAKTDDPSSWLGSHGSTTVDHEWVALSAPQMTSETVNQVAPVPDEGGRALSTPDGDSEESGISPDDAERAAREYCLDALAALLRARDKATWARAVEMLRGFSETNSRWTASRWLAERGPK